MICRIRKSPSPSSFYRASRVQWFSFGLMGAALMFFWNPLVNGGPVICLARLLFAVPCPACGVTRGTSLTFRGHPVEALQYNPLIWLVLLSGAWLMGKWTWEFLSNLKINLAWAPPLDRWGKGLVFTVITVNWVYLLIYRREDDFTDSWMGKLIAWIS